MTNSSSAATLERRVGAQRPARLHVPADIATEASGLDAIEFAESIGIVLDDWQSWLVRLLLAERDDGTLACPTAVILVPRQNGKNIVLAVVELYGLCVLGLRRQVHSAHKADTAAEHMKFLRDIIAEPDNDLGYLTVYEANGKERIVNTETKGELTFNTRTSSTKRGASPQRIVFDEALFLTDDHMQAMAPSLAAQSMSAATSPQIILTSSAPLASSVVLQRLRRQGLEGLNPRMLVADWGCTPGVDPYDRDAWYSANPGLGIRISEEFIAETELAVMSPDAFLVERLGVVFGEDGGGSELPGWLDCVDKSSTMTGPPSIGVDVAPDLSWSSIAVAGERADGLVHVELGEPLPGTSSTADALVSLWREHGRPIHLDPRSPAAGLIPALRAAGVEVVEVGPSESAKACAALRQAVAEGRVRHRSQGPLDVAVRGAAIRADGDAWRWARRSSSVDISPLVAVTLAHHAHTMQPAPGEPSFINLSDYLDPEE